LALVDPVAHHVALRRQAQLILAVAEVGDVARRHGRAVAVVQRETLDAVLQEVALGKSVVAHPPVRGEGRLERIERDLVRGLARIRSDEGGNGHRRIGGTPTGVVPRGLAVREVVVRRIQPFAHVEAVELELAPRLAVEGLVVLHERRPPRHDGRGEVAPVLRRLELPVPDRIVETEEALLVATLGPAGIEVDGQVVDGLELGPEVERRRVVLLIGLVEEGAGRKPTVVGGFDGIVARTVALKVRVLMTEQERQARRFEGLVESGITRLAVHGKARQQQALIPGVTGIHALHRHHCFEDEGKRVDVQRRLVILIDVAEAIAVLVLHLLALLLELLHGVPLPLAGIDVLEQRHLVVQGLQARRGIHCDVAAVLYRVAQRILREGRPVPTEGALVADVRRGEIEQGEFVERQLVARRHRVVVGRDLTEVLDVGHDRIAVLRIGLRIAAVDDTRRLTDQCRGAAVVVQAQALGQVPLHHVVAVPIPLLQHLRVHQHRRLHAEQVGRVVPDAVRLVGPVHGHVDRHLLQARVEVEVRQPANRLAPPEPGEGLDLLGTVGEIVTESPAVVAADVEFRVDVALVVLGVGEVGAEVAGIKKGQDTPAVLATATA